MTLFCWFCFKSQHEVRKLYPGASVPLREEEAHIFTRLVGADHAEWMRERSTLLPAHSTPYICTECVETLANGSERTHS